MLFCVLLLPQPLSPTHFERMMDRLEKGSGNTVRWCIVHVFMCVCSLFSFPVDVQYVLEPVFSFFHSLCSILPPFPPLPSFPPPSFPHSLPPSLPPSLAPSLLPSLSLLCPSPPSISSLSFSLPPFLLGTIRKGSPSATEGRWWSGVGSVWLLASKETQAGELAINCQL